ncbi:MAG: NUMOD3 domain-containing DNA-binding protein [Sulfuricaulis sp.]|nr:NUMOD3 domain-containing DNA-binding protein [Sulfuricaulis sp.]
MGTKQCETGQTQMKNQSGIYEILNTANGKRYIGSAVNFTKRWKNHRRTLSLGTHRNSKLQRAWNKYGEAAFKFLPILTCAKSMLRFYEQQLLDKVKSEYNIALDATVPMLGRKHSEASRKKMSIKLIGKPSPLRGRTLPQETKDKISEAGTGKTRSQEIKDQMSKDRIGRTHSLGLRLKMSKTRKGQKFSPEHCAAISRAQIGRKLSPEQSATQSARQTGRKLSPEQCAAMSVRMTGQKLPPAHCAAISRGLTGKTGRKATPEQRAARSLRMLGKKRGPYKTKRK